MASAVVSVLAVSTITLAAPLVLAAMGGYLSERGGVMNIALEGKMLSAACATAMAGVATGNPWIGLGAGVLTAIALSLAHWAITQRYGIDHVISGMAINAAAYGGTNFLLEIWGQQNGELSKQTPSLPIWTLEIGGAELQIGLPLVLAFLAPIFLAVYARRTRGGLWLSAVGSDPEKARLMGLRPDCIKLAGLIGTGILCGLAGALIVGATGRFTDNMTAGGGFIALAALILGGWRPMPAAVAALTFGFFKALQIQLQGTTVLGAGVPSQLWQAVPYLVAVIALAAMRGGTRAPAGMGRA